MWELVSSQVPCIVLHAVAPNEQTRYLDNPEDDGPRGLGIDDEICAAGGGRPYPVRNRWNEVVLRRGKSRRYLMLGQPDRDLYRVESDGAFGAIVGDLPFCGQIVTVLASPPAR